jgi:hypothetical protein
MNLEVSGMASTALSSGCDREGRVQNCGIDRVIKKNVVDRLFRSKISSKKPCVQKLIS